MTSFAKPLFKSYKKTKMKKIAYLLFVSLGLLLFSCSNNDDDLDLNQPSLKSASSSYYISGQIVNSTTVSYTATIENNSSVATTYNNCVVSLKFPNNIGGPSLTGEALVSLGNVKVEANSTYTKNGTIKTNTSLFAAQGGVLIFSSSLFNVQQDLGLPE